MELSNKNAAFFLNAENEWLKQDKQFRNKYKSTLYVTFVHYSVLFVLDHGLFDKKYLSIINKQKGAGKDIFWMISQR